jgi:hypothetical protein
VANQAAPREEPRFIEIPRGAWRRQAFTEEELAALRGGLSAEEYRWEVIRKWTKK